MKMKINRSVPFFVTNSIGGGFVSDDIGAIVKNERINKVWSSPSLVSAAQAVIYKTAKLNPEPYHLFNIFIHALNSVLVFCFFLLFFKLMPSFFSALLFAVHPVHTEAVSWISGLPYLFLTTFVLSSFLLYRYASEDSSHVRKKFFIGAAYLLSLFLYLCALFSNNQAVLYPAMIVLYDWIYRRRKKVLLWLPYVLITLAFVLTRTSSIGSRVETLSADMNLSGLSNSFFNIAFSIFSHLKLFFWPLKLTLYHEPLSISPGLLGIEIFLLVLFLGFSPLLFKKAKPAFFVVGIFIIFLGLTYSPVPLCWLVAERYVYLPSVGFCMLAAFLLDKYALKSPAVKEIAVIFLVIIIGLFSIRTIFRNSDWKDRASLWRATVKVSPLSPKAHNNIGDIYSLEGNYLKAAQAFQTAVKLRPDYADAYFNLALTYQKMGEMDQAVLNYKKAVSLKPELGKLIRQ
ncbi:MAG: tetratricopeptide repeat protein [Candidatus Omnitrophota bacterium]